ncbi:elongation of very long chain fatty acids protein 4-like [Leptopilina heterotoma]|uniref:elongation of very long chain fatty acids protein 4-like n=1 Tax=Leptopilina heterotoma TaxID=63436 RepID=UPI001CA9C392|nr:elongation of very long chain fatty acids protein 4-like [Leptopilina heterotoma]
MNLTDIYNHYYYEQADPRVTNWFLMGSPWPIAIILLSYIIFIFHLGPRLMKNRAAFELKTFIRFYNIFQIIANAYIIREILVVHPDATALRCDEGDYSMNPDAVRLAKACYVATMLKVIDLTETIVFVLRKKNNQVSFLHVYHHITTVSIAMLSTRYIASGMAVFYPALNCSIHVIMYTYYLLSNIEGVKKMIFPFKRYITIAQMVQFVLLIFHALVSLQPSCKVPKFPGIAMIPNVIFNFMLFFNFYKREYLSETKKTE